MADESIFYTPEQKEKENEHIKKHETNRVKFAEIMEERERILTAVYTDG